LGEISPHTFYRIPQIQLFKGYSLSGMHCAYWVVMKRFITILFLGFVLVLVTLLDYSNYQTNSCTHLEKNETEYFANELERKLHIP
jgi:hypothetical protein